MSPRVSPDQETVGSPRSAPDPRGARPCRTCRGSLGTRPPGEPGRSSRRGPLADQRQRWWRRTPGRAARRADTSLSSPYHASRSAKASLRTSVTACTPSAVEGSRASSGSSSSMRQRLEQHRALPPQVGLGDLEVAEAVHGGRLVRRAPARQVGGGHQPRVVAAAGVPEGSPLERVDRLGHEPLAPGAPRAATYCASRPAPAASPTATRRSSTSAYAGFTTSSQGRGSRPCGSQRAADVGQCSRNIGSIVATVARRPGQQRMAGPGVADGVGQHVAQRPACRGRPPASARRPRRPGRRRPAVPSPGPGRGRGRGSARGSPLPAPDPARTAPSGVGSSAVANTAGTSPPGTVQVGLDDVQDEGTGDGGVERVAARLELGHRRLRSQPVRGGGHAEGAAERRAGGEGLRTDIGDQRTALGGPHPERLVRHRAAERGGAAGPGRARRRRARRRA